MEEREERKLGVIAFSNFELNENVGMFLPQIEMRRALYQKAVPIRSIHYDKAHGYFEKMLCYCPDFREVEMGEIYPEYSVTVTTHQPEEEGGKLTYSFEFKEENPLGIRTGNQFVKESIKDID